MVNSKILDLINDRIVEEAKYIIETHCTIREVSKKFGVSKTTVHRDLTVKLKNINRSLYDEVRDILDYHTDIRGHRGAMALKSKYDKERELNGGNLPKKDRVPRKSSINNAMLICAYIKNTYASVEETTKHFNISKPTVHRRIKLYCELEPKDGELVRCIIALRGRHNSKELVATRLAALNNGEL